MPKLARGNVLLCFIASRNLRPREHFIIQSSSAETMLFRLAATSVSASFVCPIV